ncbi:hypothetical protein [Helicobacter pametensis]|uniref:hypothetical protein n=1 Tax=Helicobacter pametensis TaxID=95149 RepID=UPI00047FE500|nr:hypothetical protein [Helicobacter pametensis]
MKDLMVICSPRHKYELREHPKLREELFGDIRIIEQSAEIVLHDLDSCAKTVVYEPKEEEVIFVKKAPFLHQAYFVAEHYEIVYVLKELELLQCIFEDMGAKEIILSWSFLKSEKTNGGQSGEISAKLSGGNSDSAKRNYANLGINAENQTQKDQGIKTQGKIRTVLSGKKKSREQLRRYIAQNNINIKGFSSSVTKAINDYLTHEETNKKEIEINFVFEDFHKEKKEFIAKIKGGINIVGKGLSFIPEIKAKINRIQDKENKLHYLLKVIF